MKNNDINLVTDISVVDFNKMSIEELTNAAVLECISGGNRMCNFGACTNPLPPMSQM